MDEIALLCNLHADGPTTLRVLRRAGLRTLPQVSTVDVRKLADTLGVSPSFARRFAREARLLAGRMGAEGLDVEETAPNAAVESLRSTEALPPEPVAREPIARELTPSPKSAPERPTIVASTGTRLVGGMIAGLDRQACDRLVAHGIRTLEELAVAPGLALARRLEMPLPRLFDLQYLAQQRINAPVTTNAEPEAAADREREYVLHPSPRAPGATVSRTQAVPELETYAWRSDIGHLQPPLHVPVRADSEVAGPFA
jgi:hypothetical protein